MREAWERHETSEHIEGLLDSREIPVKLKFMNFVEQKDIWAGKEKEVKGLGGGLLIEHERDKELTISV